ncbi:TPR-like protein [Daedalea quercina L-15889]|uniref:TPR-like protein n=1 Tax=Daedalea quercina L-15889 TaxID=1314783 RepID=A0A165NGL0_9APHY|nr:TPR-like protein [Daedalea quercina L-15889]
MSSSTSSQGVVERVQSFVSENRRAVLIGTAAAVVAIGGVAYYASTSRGPGAGGDGDAEKGERKKDKKKSKKRKTVKDKDGPILEERTPKTEVSDEEDVRLSAEEIARMSIEERSAAAAALKARGNAAYSGRDFGTAIDLYTRAIDVTPKPEPVFYSNRAACYINMSPPDYDKVVVDCNEALKLDASYIKALNRRATALEALDQNEEALRDYTAATILNKFQNEAAAQSVERVLKKLAGSKAQEILAVGLLLRFSNVR